MSPRGAPRGGFADSLERGAAEMGVILSSIQVRQLLDYLELLSKWNTRYNLSAIRNPQTMLYKHLLDSLSIAPELARSGKSRLIDVGTGAGLPGIPLAICFPEKHFSLLDAAGKKTRFLVQVKQTLALENVAILKTRVEDYRPTVGYEAVLSRAFAALVDMLHGTQHLLAAGGEFWAMKGVFPQRELSELEKHYKVKACITLQVPGDIGERCLLLIESKQY